MRKFFIPAITILMSIAMLFSVLPASVFALTEPAEDSNQAELVPISETDISREEAIELLGLTAEEAETVDFYSVSSTNSALGEGVHDLGTFTFTDSNGGSFRTINGSKVKYAVQFKGYENRNGMTPYMWVYFLQYWDTEFDRMLCIPTDKTEKTSDGYYNFYSDWINVNYGVDYRFTYYLRVLGDAEGSEFPLKASVRVVIAVAK